MLKFHMPFNCDIMFTCYMFSSLSLGNYDSWLGKEILFALWNGTVEGTKYMKKKQKKTLYNFL